MDFNPGTYYKITSNHCLDLEARKCLYKCIATEIWSGLYITACSMPSACSTCSGDQRIATEIWSGLYITACSMPSAWSTCSGDQCIATEIWSGLYSTACSMPSACSTCSGDQCIATEIWGGLYITACSMPSACSPCSGDKCNQQVKLIHNIMITAEKLLQKNADHLVDFIWFSDENLKSLRADQSWSEPQSWSAITINITRKQGMAHIWELADVNTFESTKRFLRFPERDERSIGLASLSMKLRIQQDQFSDWPKQPLWDQYRGLRILIYRLPRRAIDRLKQHISYFVVFQIF